MKKSPKAAKGAKMPPMAGKATKDAGRVKMAAVRGGVAAPKTGRKGC